MRLQFKTSTLAAALTLLVSLGVKAEDSNSVWLARLTGNLSCEHRVRSTLGEAVQELEQLHVVIEEAKVGRLTDRFFCKSCSCPDGSFNIVKVVRSEFVGNAIENSNWEVIAPETIESPRKPLSAFTQEEGDYRLQPVNPEI